MTTPRNRDELPPAEDRTVEEEALGDLRGALRHLHALPAAGLSGEQQHSELAEATERVEALEAELTNQVSQQRGDADE